MAPPGGEAGQPCMDPQTGLSAHGPAGAAPDSVTAGAQPAARKTVSSKSTPNDDASEASTNEAAVSEIATPSPSEEFQPAATANASAGQKGSDVRSPLLRSPVIQPSAAKSPAEDLAVHANRREARVVAVAVGGSGGPLPPLVHSKSSVTSPSEADAAAMVDSSNDTDTVTARLHQNLGLKSTPQGAPHASTAASFEPQVIIISCLSKIVLYIYIYI
jgi:hypothetical protein